MTEPTAPRAGCPAGGALRTGSEMLALRLPQDTEDRQRVQARHGAAVLGAVADGTDCVWGWQGESFSLPVLDTASGAQRWMKLRSRPAADPVPTLWSGVAAAERVMAGLPVLRPVLLAQQAWACDGFAYQTELTTRMPVRSIGLNRAAPEWMADLPAAWWADLRAALDRLQAAPAAGLEPADRQPPPHEKVTPEQRHRGQPRQRSAGRERQPLRRRLGPGLRAAPPRTPTSVACPAECVAASFHTRRPHPADHTRRRSRGHQTRHRRARRDHSARRAGQHRPFHGEGRRAPTEAHPVRVGHACEVPGLSDVPALHRPDI
ncbi:hypothetical protein [Streptomyces sp. NPDC059631]|uniref:hypothetical protein n=1 Tax=unclassified Streptomyces TaxID=2593676 RepID=UPI0036841D7E